MRKIKDAFLCENYLQLNTELYYNVNQYEGLSKKLYKEMVERKLSMYAWPFQAARGLDFFAEPTAEGSAELKTAIRQDLARFLPPETFSVQEKEGFAPLLDALCKLFTELRKAKVKLP